MSRTPLIKYTQSPSHLLLSNGCDTLNREARQQSAAWRLTNTEDDHNHELIMFLQLISRSKAASILQEFYLKASDPSVVRRLKKKKNFRGKCFQICPVRWELVCRVQRTMDRHCSARTGSINQLKNPQ